jgi:hypothetical protein
MFDDQPQEAQGGSDGHTVVLHPTIYILEKVKILQIQLYHL